MKNEILYQDTSRMEPRLQNTESFIPFAQAIVAAYQREKTPEMQEMDDNLFQRLITRRVDLTELFWDSVQAPVINGLRLAKESLDVEAPTFRHTLAAVEGYVRQLQRNTSRRPLPIVVIDGTAQADPQSKQNLIDSCTIYLDSNTKKRIWDKLQVISQALVEVEEIGGMKRIPFNPNSVAWKLLAEKKDTLPLFREILSASGDKVYGRSAPLAVAGD